MSTIFISYRRQDGISYALPDIKKKLESVFGPESVFFDLDIALGVNFADHIREHIVKSSVVLAFIGENWLGMAANGERRIDDQNDFVRIELALALREGKTVIPVFTGTAGPSVLDHLPEPVSALRFINGIEMRAGAMYAYQFESLIERLKGALGVTHRSKSTTARASRSAVDLTTARDIFKAEPDARVYDLVTKLAEAYSVDRAKAYGILYRVRKESK